MTRDPASTQSGNDSAPAAPTGYRLILPPGWARIPLRDGTAEALEELVFPRLKALPPEVPKDQGMKYRLMIRRSVEQQIIEARKANGLDLYLPVQPRYRALVSASFLVSQVKTDGASFPGPWELPVEA